MKFIVVTGGIASGKSTVVRMLSEFCGKSLYIFDCDAALSQLYQSGRMSRDLVAHFGADALDEKGAVNKDFLREIVKNDPQGRHQLEALVHPKLAEMCQEARAKAAASGKVQAFILDIPLFFENDLQLGQDCVCVVASSSEIQIKRLMKRDSCRRKDAKALIDIQCPTQDKIDRADLVFWNEGSEKLLQEQVQGFCEREGLLFEEDEEPEPEALPVINLNELRALPFHEIQKLVATLPKRGLSALSRADMLAELGRFYLIQKREVIVTGVLELCNDNFAMLRDEKRSFLPSSDDIYVSLNLIQKLGLRAGNLVTVRLRPSRNQDKYLAAESIIAVEGMPVEEFVVPKHFDKLTPLFPRERLILENAQLKYNAMRLLDLITPLGMGQRGLLVAPPRGGKTVLLKMIAKSLRANYPETEIIILLLDERPEEVTDFEESVDAPVYASTFDEPSKRHAHLSDIILERAKRRVEQGKNVIILLDSLTRLARGYNANMSGGRTMSGGLGSGALEKPRKFFAAARNVEEGGSLTIIATCLVETESRMDEIIFEEFKGTGNMEIQLDRELSERRIYPAINISRSGTRNDDRLYHPEEMMRVLQIRRQVASMVGWEGLESLLRNIGRTQNNAELLLRGVLG